MVAVYLNQSFCAPSLHHFRALVQEGLGILQALQFGNYWLSKAAAFTSEPSVLKGNRSRDESLRCFP